MNDMKDKIIIEMQKRIQQLERELNQEKRDSEYLLKLFAKALNHSKIVVNDDEIKGMKIPEFRLEENPTGNMIVSIRFGER